MAALCPGVGGTVGVDGWGCDDVGAVAADLEFGGDGGGADFVACGPAVVVVEASGGGRGPGGGRGRPWWVMKSLPGCPSMSMTVSWLALQTIPMLRSGSTLHHFVTVSVSVDAAAAWPFPVRRRAGSLLAGRQGMIAMPALAYASAAMARSVMWSWHFVGGCGHDAPYGGGGVLGDVPVRSGAPHEPCAVWVSAFVPSGVSRGAAAYDLAGDGVGFAAVHWWLLVCSKGMFLLVTGGFCGTRFGLSSRPLTRVEPMTWKRRAPLSALRVTVEEAFLHCGRA